MCLAKSVKSSPLSTGWVLAGPLYRCGEEAITEEQEALSLTGACVNIFPLSLWRQALSPDSAVTGASGARQPLGCEEPQSVRLQGSQTYFPCWSSDPTEQVSYPLLLSAVFPSLLSLLFHPAPFREDKYTPYDIVNFIKGGKERGRHMTDTWVGPSPFGESQGQADGGHTRLNRSCNGCPGVLVLIPR